MKVNSLFIFVLLFFCFGQLLSQGLPNSNVYLFSFSKNGEKLNIKDAEHLTAFNKTGFNDQPVFFDDNTLFITTDYYKTSTEIIKLDLIENVIYRLTETVENEYSPQILKNRRDFTVVRVESDNVSQVMHKYPLSLKDNGVKLFPSITNLGYYTFDFNQDAYMFLVGNPHQLAHMKNGDQTPEVIFENIGRCLKMDKYGDLLFIHKLTDSKWMVKSLSSKTKRAKIIHPAILGSEDFDYLSSNELIAAKGSKIFKLSINNNLGWKEIADLSEYGIGNIKRIIIRKNKLVVVEEN